MKIILTEDINKLGLAGDVVNVANGFARNYLLPQKKAILATPQNLKKAEAIKVEGEEKRKVVIAKIEELAKSINGTKIDFLRKTDERGNMFGSVSEIDIAAALKEKGFDVHKAAVKLDKHIKELGEFAIAIEFNYGVKAEITITVASENHPVIEEKQEVKAEEAVEEVVEEETTEEAKTDVEKEIQHIENSEAID